MIGTLPVDVLVRIVIHVHDPVGFIEALSKTNENFRDIFESPGFWKRVVLAKWPSNFPLKDPRPPTPKLHVDDSYLYRNTFHSWAHTFNSRLKYHDHTRTHSATNPRTNLHKLSNRKICTECGRPLKGCLCAYLPSSAFKNDPMRIIVFVHPKCQTSTGTVQVLMKVYENIKIIIDADVDQNHEFYQIMADGTEKVLLYPSSDSQDIRTYNGNQWIKRNHKTLTLVVLDGSWGQVKAMIRWNPRLRELPRVQITGIENIYRHLKREPNDDAMSTAEAVGICLKQFAEYHRIGDPEITQNALSAIIVAVKGIITIQKSFEHIKG